MIRIVPSNKLLMIYLAQSGITYIGLLMGSTFGTYFGLALFIAFTSYVLSWYLLAMVTVMSSRLIFGQSSLEIVIGSSTTVYMKVLSELPVHWEVELELIHTPHVQSSPLRVRVNDGEYAAKLIGRWIGIARIIGGLLTIEEPLGLLKIQGLLLHEGVDIIIRPRRRTNVPSGEGVGGYVGRGPSSEGRLGDFRSLASYDYERPASMIHWLTSARVGDLMMIVRSDYGSCPIFIVNASSRALIPRGDKRPIDDALQIISDASQYCGYVKALLVRRGRVEERVVNYGIIPYLEREIRMSIIRDLNMNEALVGVPTYFRKYLREEDVLSIAYISVPMGDEPLTDELNKILNTVGNRERVVLLNLDMDLGGDAHYG